MESTVDRNREQFTRQAEAYARMHQARDEKALRGLVALARVEPGEAALDVACGPGNLALALARAGARAAGVDATPAMLALARATAQRAGVDIAFEQADAAKLPFEAGRFDLVTCRAAFHHFGDPGVVLAEMARVARTGGRLLIADMVSSEDSARAAYHDSIEKLCDPSHVHALSVSELRALFAARGLEVTLDLDTALDYELDEWLAHGGPGPAAAAEIRALLEASIETDRSGLRVRRDAATLRFTHTAKVYVLRTPAA